MVGVAVADVLLAVVLAVSQAGFWRQPGALAYLVPVLVMLAMYAAGGIAVVIRPELALSAALRVGGAVGLPPVSWRSSASRSRRSRD